MAFEIGSASQLSGSIGPARIPARLGSSNGYVTPQQIADLAAASGGTADFNSLTDVTITAPSTGQAVRYNGTAWVNAAMSVGDITSLQAMLDAKAPSASPALSGIPTTPTAAPGTNNTQVASTAFVTSAVAASSASGPGLLSLEALIGPGVVTAVSTDNFAMRPIGSSGATDILDRTAGDGRYAVLGHTHTAVGVTDFSEAVDDRIAALLQAGSNITVTYNDTSNTLTLAATGLQPADNGLTSISALTGTGVLVATATDAYTLLPTGTAASTNILTRADGDGRYVATSNFTESAQDVVGTMVAAAGGTYDDTAGTITLPSGGTGGAGVTSLEALTGTGVVVATATDTFAMRPTGVAASTDILTRADGDGRYVASATFTEASQDIVGAMVAAAGGSYDDAAATITLPAGGSAIYMDGAIDPHASPYNCKGDAIEGTDATTYVAAELTVPGYTWKTGDVGKLLWLDSYATVAPPRTITAVNTGTNRATYSGASVGAGTGHYYLCGVDDTAGLQAALDAAATSFSGALVGDGSMVWSPRHAFGRSVRMRSGCRYIVRNTNSLVPNVLTVRRRTGLSGAGGRMSEIVLAPLSYGDILANEGAYDPDVSGYADFIQLSGFSINGVRFANPTAGNGVTMILGYSGYTFTDAFPTVDDVSCYEISKTGFRIRGRGEGVYSRLRSMQCSEYGFWIAPAVDSTFVSCNSGGSGLSGFRIGGAPNCRFLNCKSFYSGNAGNGALEPWNTANWYLETAGEFRAGLCMFNGCEGQEARGSNWYIEGGLNVFSGCLAYDPGRAALAGTTVIKSGFHLAGASARLNTFSGCRVGPSVTVYDATNWTGTNAVHVDSGAHMNTGDISTFVATDGNAGATYSGGAVPVGGAGWLPDRNPNLFVDGISPRGRIAGDNDPIVQTDVAAGATLTLTAGNTGNDIYLLGSGSGISCNAAVLGKGFAFTIRNRTGADWTVAGISGATLEFEDGGTKVANGKSASVVIADRSSVRYAVVSGATVP